MLQGLYFYMKPDLSRLVDTRVWNDAANQIFFVLAVAYGGLITLSSYNKFNQTTLGLNKTINYCIRFMINFSSVVSFLFFRNALVISITNVITSIFAGFVIFAYLGYLSYITGQDVQDVVSEGKELFLFISLNQLDCHVKGLVLHLLFILMQLRHFQQHHYGQFFSFLC